MTDTLEINKSQLVAQVIKDQLGNRALFMMGAQNIYHDKGDLIFKIRGSRHYNHIRLHLDMGTDIYEITFSKVTKANLKQHVVSGVYSDNLHKMISKHTELYLSL